MNNDEKSQLIFAAAYFKQKKAYERVFRQLREKWKRYGRITGIISLKQPSPEEKQVLGDFLGRDFTGEGLRFSVADFESALNQTKFKGITVASLLEAYYGEQLITNKEIARKKQADRQAFFMNLYNWSVATYGELARPTMWLSEVLRLKKHGYQLLLAEYQNSEENAAQAVRHVLKALSMLELREDKTLRLALLSAQVTRNPHAFDRKNLEGKLLIQALSCLNGNVAPQSAEEVFMLYHDAGILPDDISSFTTAYGISMYMGAVKHEAYQSFIANREPYVITLSNLSRIDRADCQLRRVFVLENQMVFSHMCEELKGREVSLICTSGQAKTASLVLIDLLCAAGCDIYYAGDFDPEGLTIADRIIGRNPQQITPWHMTPEDYEHALSGERLDELRLAKLAQVRDSRLQPVCQAVFKRRLAGYQEQLISAMIRDILSMC